MSARCRITTTNTTARRRSRSTPRSTPRSTTRCPSASCSTTSAASCARAACASRARSPSPDALGVLNRGDHSLIRPVGRRRLRDRPVFRQRHRHLPGGRAAVARLPAQGAGLVPRAHAFRSVRLRARLQRQHLAPQGRMEAEGAGPQAERAHRPRHAARERGRERAVDLQQGPRPGTDLRARSRRAGHAQGPAGRA